MFLASLACFLVAIAFHHKPKKLRDRIYYSHAPVSFCLFWLWKIALALFIVSPLDDRKWRDQRGYGNDADPRVCRGIVAFDSIHIFTDAVIPI